MVLVWDANVLKYVNVLQPMCQGVNVEEDVIAHGIHVCWHEKHSV